MGSLNQEKVESSEKPNECQDFINYDPKTAAGKRKRDTDEEVVDSDQCVNYNKMRRLCNVDVKQENQQVKIIDQELCDLSVEEIERNLDAMFGMISENKSMAKGCNEDDDMVKIPLPLSSSMDFFNYNEFDYSFEWLNLPGLTNDDDDAMVKMRRLCNVDVKQENQSMEENKLMAKGCNGDADMVMMPLPLSSSMDFFNYNQDGWLNLPGLSATDEDEFDISNYDQDEWLNLPVSSNTTTTDDGEFDFFNYDDQDEWLNLPGLSNTDENEFDLSVEEIERNLDKLMEENESMVKGCNEDEDDMVMMNEFPSLPLEPEFDYQSSSSMEDFSYNSGSDNEFDYGINQEDWVNLPVLTDNYSNDDDGNVFDPFLDLINLEFQALNSYAGNFTNMINCC